MILLSKENAQIDELKEQLRERNIALKELRRNLEEKLRLQQQKSLVQLPTVTAAAAEAGGGNAIGKGSSTAGGGQPAAAVAEAKELEHHSPDHHGDKKGAK